MVEQISGWPGRELLPPFEVEIFQDGFEYRFLANNANLQSYVKLVKKDIETGKTVPVPNTAFRLKNPDGSPVKMTLTYPTVETIEAFYTNSEGYLVTPQPLPYGKGYACIEEAAPEGYVINWDPVYFDITEENSTKESAVTVVLVEKMNMAQKGVVEINKKGEVFWSVEKSDDSYQPVYKESGLPGSVFIFADEDIYTRDGTLRAAKGFANRKIKGTAATTKVDASNPDNKLPGALFEIYRDTNGDGLYTDGVDELVGEMTETETGVYKMTDLEADCYFLYERQAPESFIRDERYYAFLIETDGKTVWIENKVGVGFINQPEIPDIPDEPENPDHPSIPQTGDNSKLWLWFVLTGASSAAIVTVTIVSKKRKVRGK